MRQAVFISLDLESSLLCKNAFMHLGLESSRDKLLL